MKVLYDHQIFTSQQYGGISRYFYELIKELDLINEMDIKTSLLFSNNHYIADAKIIKNIKFLPNKEFRGKQKLLSQFNKILSIYQLKKQKFDIFHPTYYNPYFLKNIGNRPFVITVHDMIHEKFPNEFSKRDKTSEQKSLLVNKASKIIAVSENTKRDLVEIFGTPESKIEIVYHGGSMVDNNNVILDFDLPPKYILFVGGRAIYKNFNRFINSISNLLNEDKELSVVCVGGGKFKAEELKLFDLINIKNQLLQYNLDDEKLSLFYKKALLFVFPSLYEGFGIPILEAFSCKCPLVCSNTSSLPEVAENGAVYFNPYDRDSIYEAVKQVLENTEIRKLIVENGTKRIKQFSWKKTAVETKRIYQGLI